MQKIEDRQIITATQALAMLPNGNTIHTYRNPVGGVFIGADWARDEIARALHSYEVELTGPLAANAGYGLAFTDLYGVVFVKTKTKAAHQQINQDSGCTEYWTPKRIVAVANVLMEGIDLDVACSVEAWAYHDKLAQRIISAGSLSALWAGRVWMNHPFAKGEKKCKPNCQKKICQARGHITEEIPGNEAWINKLVASHRAGQVDQACCITFASTSERWFEPLLSYPQFIFANGRIDYIDPGTLLPTKGATKGSVFTWLYDSRVLNYRLACEKLQEEMLRAGYEGVAK